MGKIMTAFIAVIGIMLVFSFFPDFLTSTHELLTDQETYTSEVTTGGGVTTAGVVLALGVYNDDVNNIVSVSSDNGNDTPIASTWTALTTTLTVSGLQASASRDLSVVYEWEATSEYTGMTTLVEMAPTLLILGIIGVVLFGLFAAVRSRAGA